MWQYYSDDTDSMLPDTVQLVWQYQKWGELGFSPIWQDCSVQGDIYTTGPSNASAVTHDFFGTMLWMFSHQLSQAMLIKSHMITLLHKAMY